jgi:hypothetical protein
MVVRLGFEPKLRRYDRSMSKLRQAFAESNAKTNFRVLPDYTTLQYIIRKTASLLPTYYII